jgi:hypothetical protein
MQERQVPGQATCIFHPKAACCSHPTYDTWQCCWPRRILVPSPTPTRWSTIGLSTSRCRIKLRRSLGRALKAPLKRLVLEVRFEVEIAMQLKLALQEVTCVQIPLTPNEQAGAFRKSLRFRALCHATSAVELEQGNSKFVGGNLKLHWLGEAHARHIDVLSITG